MVERHLPEQAPQCAPDILETLRRATAGRHAAIDELLDLRRPFGSTHYARVLQGFAAFLSAWEPRMAALLPQRLQAWFDKGQRLHLLQGDLLALGVHPAPPAQMPDLSTLAQAMGSLYVMEGSALGGQFIANHVRRHLGLTPEHGASYFHGAGRATAQRWREFRDLLARELQADAAAWAQAVHAAEQTFDVLTAHFRSLLDERAAA